MHIALIALVVLAVIIGGLIMGIASLVILPIAGFIILIGLLFWAAKRRSEDRPPIP